MNARPNIVLVHGAWADGSSWSGVIGRLQAAGYHVTAPQFPMTSLVADVARLRQVLDFQNGPVIVAGHSYGGQIMTALGADAPNVAGLVYIAAFGTDHHGSRHVRRGAGGHVASTPGNTGASRSPIRAVKRSRQSSHPMPSWTAASSPSRAAGSGAGKKEQ